MKFEISVTDKSGKARRGKITTSRGSLETPVFMPVGTAATVKSIHQRDLEETINAEIILSNTYHLFLRPGCEIIKAAGGLHRFMSWDRLILTDSGGYQVFSLSENRKITEEGVSFRAHTDGSKHFFTPENIMDIQRDIGADIIMAFDECTPYPCDKTYAKDSMERTHRWLKRCIHRFEEGKALYGHEQYLFPIVQGSVYPELRKQSAEFITNCDLPANAIGGLSVGEPQELLYEMTNLVCDILPAEKPRYLMGVGTPADILECIAAGVDMFDCVMPTRNARNGMLFTMDGIINIRNKKWEIDFSPINRSPLSFVDEYYSKAYIRHLFRCNEMLGPQIATINNLALYFKIIELSRQHIENGTFMEWKSKMIPQLTKKL